MKNNRKSNGYGTRWDQFDSQGPQRLGVAIASLAEVANPLARWACIRKTGLFL